MISENKTRVQITMSHKMCEELNTFAHEHGMTKSEAVMFIWLHFSEIIKGGKQNA